MKKKLLIFAPLTLGVVLLISVIGIKISINTQQENTSILTSSTLIEAIDISELSVAQFTYNGIAEIYDEDGEDVECYIRYHATVNAGIEMTDVEFLIDEDKKTIQPILPEITVLASPIEEQSFSFIPADAKLEMKEILIACKEDAEREASQSKELTKSAEENLKAVVEALIYPLIDQYGYSVVWE